MSAVFSAVKKFFRPKGLVGYDLQGNRYFEIPNPAGGRMKRFVEYKKTRDLSEYSRAELKPPVQWRAWLSHTRVEPPTLPELSTDTARQESLLPKIAAIEAREREERIRQGYLLPDGSVPPQGPGGKEYGQVAGPSTPSERRARIERIGQPQPQPQPQPQSQSQQSQQQSQSAYPTTSSSAATGSGSGSGSNSRAGTVPNALTSDNRSTSPSSSNTYPVPTPTSDGIAPPRDPRSIDPSKYASTDELRRLAMEDTKRRIAESGGEQQQQQPSTSTAGKKEGDATQNQNQSQSQGQGGSAPGGLQPRRRGRK
ncbi:hypothetical protein IAT40_002424 [Kwoniella sp. CBS 6097]